MCKCYAKPKEYDDFVNLHLHTNFSLLDGLSKPKDAIKKVATLKQKAVAVTEHGNTFSAVKAHKYAKEFGVKHIYGCEFYICKDRFEKDKSNKYYHLTILAKNEKGRLNINKLCSLGYMEGFYFKPRIDHELLSQYSEGLIVLSGCMASELQQSLAGGKIGDSDIKIHPSNIEKAKEVACWYRNVFGSDYYLEVQAHEDYRQQKLNRAIVDLANELNIGFVATTDSHFVDEDDLELHSIFIQIGQNREPHEDTYRDTHIMDSHEVIRKLQGKLTLEEAVKSVKESMKIADKCNVTLPLSEPIIPHVDVPVEFNSEVEYLKNLINKGWIKREIHRKNKEEVVKYRERLKYEFDAIEKMGFEGYFLLVEGYVNSVERKGIARGSSGGSLIAYLLNITDLDPIPYGLYFERFIDVGAVDLLEEGVITRKELKIPDVDSDFASESRDDVINFIVNKYGENKYASLGQFGYIWSKSAIKDVGRVLGINFNVTNKITQLLGDSTIEEAKNTTLRTYVEQYPKLFEYAEKLEGVPKSFGVHPCGKVVSVKDTDYYSSLAVNDGEFVIQGDMDDAEDLGLVKIDILGLSSLSVIYDTLEMIGETKDYIKTATMDYSDEKVLDVFKTGSTCGVFQFESSGMRDTLRKIQPRGVEDLGVANALFRPSSLKQISHYAKRKNGEEEVDYLHKDLEMVLGDTYGIFVFQEQLITLGRLAGMKNADLLRKATGKKDLETMKKARNELFTGLKSRGWNDEQLEELWEIMLDFARYSFNKSHAIAYAITAFQMAKLKAYHPTEFMTALMNSKFNKKDELSTYINECKSLGIKILPPSLKSINKNFEVVGENQISFGLLGIKGVGEPTIEELFKIKDCSINNLEEFMKAVKDKNLSISTDTIINFIKSGMFGENRNKILLKYFELSYIPTKFKDRVSIPSKKDLMNLMDKLGEKYIYMDDVFSDKEYRLSEFNRLKHVEYAEREAKRREKSREFFVAKYIKNEEMYDFEMMNAYVTKNPFEQHKHLIPDFALIENGKEKVFTIGTVLSIAVKKGSMNPYGIINLVTPCGIVKCKAYSNAYAENKELFFKGNNIALLGKKVSDEFVISKIKSFDEWKEIINANHKCQKK